MVEKGHYNSERALLAFRVSDCDSAEACSATVSTDSWTDVLLLISLPGTKLTAQHFLVE